MKCTQCGNDKFFNVRLEGPTDDGWWCSENFVPFVCDKCGHVELYVSQKVLDKYTVKQKEDTSEAEFNKEKVDIIERIVSEIQTLKTFITDENNTVKEVKEAQNLLVIKEQELDRVKRRFYRRKDEEREIYS